MRVEYAVKFLNIPWPRKFDPLGCGYRRTRNCDGRTKHTLKAVYVFLVQRGSLVSQQGHQLEAESVTGC